MVSQVPLNQLEHCNTPVTGTIYTYTFAPALILCLFEAEAHVCNPKMAKNGLKYWLCLFPLCVPGSVINLSLPLNNKKKKEILLDSGGSQLEVIVSPPLHDIW
jgi:hypothetical protein